MCFRIPKGFKSIGVGELCDAHGGSENRFLTLEGSNIECHPFRSDIFLSPIRGRRATLARGY